MIDDPSYVSLLVRLWREPGNSSEAWCGEIEEIQSGEIVVASSLEEVLTLIQRTVAGDAERRRATDPNSSHC